MKNKNSILYFFIAFCFIICTIVILSNTNLANSIQVSKATEVILILYLFRISYGCALYVERQYKKKKYSYAVILNLGLLLFIAINILRHINLLICNWNELNIVDIYKNTLDSFSYFAMLTLPCIIVLSIYSIVTNIVLIKKEGFKYTNFLGIILGMLAIIGLFGSQTIYMITERIIYVKNDLLIKLFIDSSINIILTYFYTLVIATLYCNIMAANHVPSYDKDFVIILGSKINLDGSLSPLLKGRVDKAIDFGKNQYKETNKKIIYVPSGGKGIDEVMSEAKAMKNYLIQNGIDEDSIIIENKSVNTSENMKFSKEKIDKIKKDSKIIFSTTNYHVFRSGVIANKLGINCEGMGSKTKWYFHTNALIREFVANLYQERKKHFLIILIIMIMLYILIAIGYKYNLL